MGALSSAVFCIYQSLDCRLDLEVANKGLRAIRGVGNGTGGGYLLFHKFLNIKLSKEVKKTKKMISDCIQI